MKLSSKPNLRESFHYRETTCLGSLAKLWLAIISSRQNDCLIKNLKVKALVSTMEMLWELAYMESKSQGMASKDQRLVIFQTLCPRLCVYIYFSQVRVQNFNLILKGVQSKRGH